MLEINEANVKAWSELGAGGSFGQAMMDVAESFPQALVICADLTDATRVREFSKRFPERFVQVGIAEQNAIGIAAGLALAGKMPFVTTFACFASMRCCEQVRTDLAYPNLNVKLVGSYAGVAFGTLGTTHYALEDVGILRSIANMVVLCPADGLETVKATWAAAQYPGPVYLRLTGGRNLPIVFPQDYSFVIGKAITLREGADASILATGSMVSRALSAADALTGEGIAVRVLDVHTLKPMDAEAVRRAALETGLLVTVEEHSIMGGLGSAVAEVLAEMGGAPRLVRMGLPDRFVRIANYATILNRCGLTEQNIAQTVKSNLGVASHSPS